MIGELELADRDAIHDTIVRYAQGVDQRQWPLYLSAFTADAVIEVPGFLADATTPEAFADVLRAAFDDTRLSGQHYLGAPLIATDGPARARAVTEFLAVNTSRAGGDSNLVDVQRAAGIYVDRLVCTSGEWRIAHRTLVQKTHEVEHRALSHDAGAARNPALATFLSQTAPEDTVPLTPSQLSDRAEIHDTLSAYAHAQDQNAWHLYDDIFVDGALIELPGTGIGPLTAEELKIFLRDDFNATRLSGQHLIGNVLVDLSGDAARSAAEVLYVTLQYTDVEGRLLVTQGTSLYLDEWRRTDAGWRISHRIATQKYTERAEKDYTPEQIAAVSAGAARDWFTSGGTA